jgi:hypothetical protein
MIGMAIRVTRLGLKDDNAISDDLSCQIMVGFVSGSEV